MAFKLCILQVRCGDAIIVKYANQGRNHNIIIDGGYLDTYTDALQPQLKSIGKEKGVIDPWILTHLDADHINGFVSYLRDTTLTSKSNCNELWFNCFDYFRVPGKSGLVSVGKGIEIRDALKIAGLPLLQGIASGYRTTKGGATIQVLTPDKGTLDELGLHWKKEEAAYQRKKGAIAVARKGGNDFAQTIETLVKKKDAKSPAKSDITNRSSISFILSIEGKRILFLGDSYPADVIKAISPIKRNSERLKFDYVKLSHHGSRKNFSSALLDVIDCDNFIISSNGTNQHFIPDKETLAKILAHPKRDRTKEVKFIFNYGNKTLKAMFDVDKATKKNYNFKCLFPKKNAHYYELKL